MSASSKLLGLASMAASLGAIAFLITSDVAVAEEPNSPPPAQQKVELDQVNTLSKAESQPQPQQKQKPAQKKRKRIDLGRFEGY